MLSKLDEIQRKYDGRYVDDEELQMIQDYCDSYQQRIATYQKLHAMEAQIVNESYQKLKAKDPALLASGGQDLTDKWKRDTIRVLRYTAVAMLLNDPAWLRERFLLWFETIMRAFKAQESCYATYEVMQEVVKQHLTLEEARLFCPLLELNKEILGQPT